MRRAIVALAIVCLSSGWAAGAAAQVPSGGYFSGGAYYVPDPAASPYWPTNNETAYYYGPYAVAPGYGPYLRLGGESGWNPNIGTTYNAYPPGDYYTDYAPGYVRVAAYPPLFVAPVYRGWPVSAVPFCWPGYPFCR